MTAIQGLPRLSMTERNGASGSLKILFGLAVLACLLSFAARFFIGLKSSLFLDETWTGAFATEHTLGAVTQQIRDDVNAPFYYFLIWLWAKLFGVSNMALRIPSVLFSLAAPVAAWTGLRKREPSIALVWASLLALWVPGIGLSGYARCYSLLVLVGTVNAIAFLNALERPTLGRTAIWTLSASLAVLTHYHAAFLALAEAAVYVAVNRTRISAILKLWPAALTSAPAFGWIAYHAPRLEQFSRPAVAWYDRLALTDTPLIATFMLGSFTACLIVVTALSLAMLMGRRTAAKSSVDSATLGGQTPSLLCLSGLASVIAASACLIVACIRPSFTARYLTAFTPGVLLLVACATDRLSHKRWEPQAVLIGGMGVLCLCWMVKSAAAGERLYSFEPASAYIAAGKPDKLAFYWDHPATPFEAPAQLDRVGGFFLRRAGYPIKVEPIYPRGRRRHDSGGDSWSRSPWRNLVDVRKQRPRHHRGHRSA